MILESGAPSVIEFNCRFGDPEAQAILPVLPEGILPVLRMVAEGGWMPAGLKLGDARGASVTTVLAAAGYPDAPTLGAEITIPADLEAAGDVLDLDQAAPTPSFFRKDIIGHQFVKPDWNRFRPTKAVNRYQ